jgi:hypothetical protein
LRILSAVRCFFRGHHNPVRHPLGVFKCADCGALARDLDDMGLHGHGYVSPVRRLFSGRSRDDRINRWEHPRSRR